ncbi:NUDIX domain-containing protein [Phycicoccus sp. CSK15P-2]|uniref:NUDIX hydrolase n=1 Tax=Phycicoccus sp. CSK15P-2 TaxID=2807627 RepID=UPI00194F77C4|nr:NUDIX domain-containing protein [Phycicoccus sp. CSK15P-2]MBM6402805.1 NUDIX domain-containing protein [Phycicoccus sp. CSK15P-2]
MITVVGEADGRRVVAVELGHGADPRDELLRRGWASREVRVDGGLGDLVLTFTVQASSEGARGPATVPVEGGTARRRRVAAYAVVVADGSLLLTQLSDRTGASGRWNLPGGGLDPGEAPADAVVREVMEETGQVVDAVRLVEVVTRHWTGGTGAESLDNHAVRLLHSARCTEPTRPVVHDVGGSTSDARWVPLERLGEMPVVATVPTALEAVGHRWEHPWPQS